MQRFLEWFSKLCADNERARVDRVAALNDFCDRAVVSTDGRSAARCFFGLNNQRVIAVRESSGDGEQLLLQAAEREWGRGVFRFTGCSAFEGGTLPMPGYLYGFEGKAGEDGRFHVEMLFDASFGKGEYPERLMDDDDWYELSFDCSGMTAEPELYDYAGRMQRMGTPRFELLERCCALLVSKYEVLGTSSLTAAEREFLPAAQLLYGSDSLINRDDAESDNHCRRLILQALGNRYAMRRLRMLITGAGGSRKLREALDGTLDSFEREDDEDDIVKHAEGFWGRLETEVSCGSARPLLAALADALSGMTSELPADPYRSGHEAELLGRVKNAVAPELERMGFSGCYPHYFRERDSNMEYISFMLDPDTDRPRKGIISYYASIAAAQLPRDQYRMLETMGVPRDKANALDCLPEEIGLSNYGELAGASDAQYVRMDVKLYGGGIIRDESGRLPHFVRLAETQFRRERLPAAYRRMRLRAGAARGSLLRSLSACSPVGVVTAVILLLVYNLRLRGQPYYTLSRELSVAASLGGGLLAAGAAALIRNLLHSFGIWRY